MRRCSVLKNCFGSIWRCFYDKDCTAVQRPDAQILMRNYMMERFLERISLSEYQDKFILKGGMLVAAMVGLDDRSTMDIDATVKGATVGIEEVENMIASIISVPVDDGVEFRVKRISEIMDEAEYPGIRVSMETEFDSVITPSQRKNIRIDHSQWEYLCVSYGLPVYEVLFR